MTNSRQQALVNRAAKKVSTEFSRFVDAKRKARRTDEHEPRGLQQQKQTRSSPQTARSAGDQRMARNGRSRLSAEGQMRGE